MHFPQFILCVLIHVFSSATIFGQICFNMAKNMKKAEKAAIERGLINDLREILRDGDRKGPTKVVVNYAFDTSKELFRHEALEAPDGTFDSYLRRCMQGKLRHLGPIQFFDGETFLWNVSAMPWRP